MKKSRLEAFSDAVMAIIITIMVLEIKAPDNATLKALIPVFPIFVTYLLSFIYIGIYWINHHHIMMVTEKINSKVLWLNMNLLFWLSLIPFATSWMDENHFEPIPVAVYGMILLLCALSFKLLENSLIKIHDENFPLRKAVKNGKKEYISMLLYIAAIPLAFVHTFISIFCYVVVAIMWFFPNKQLEMDSKE